MKKCLGAGGVSLFLAIHGLSPAFAIEPVVKAANGAIVSGVVDPDGFEAFRGVKYALPPVGDLRWKPPVANDLWTAKGAFPAFETTCATADTLGVFGKKSDHEDCLYLNVYRPAALKAGEAAPVLAWIHGGGLGTGSGNDYNPSYWTERGVVVVTMNYRLGIFGFFSDETLDAANLSAGLSDVNYGLMDQQAALKWIAKNIAAFGGDPGNITIFGESAGGFAVLGHMAAPGSAGLFHKAIASSGSFSLNQINRYQLRAVHSSKMVEKTKCAAVAADKRVACLKALTTEEVLAAAPSYTSLGAFATGTESFPLGVLDAFDIGRINRTPLISGANHDEGTFFAFAISGFKSDTLSEKQFTMGVQGSLGESNAQKIAGLAPVPKDGNYFGNAARYIGDSQFICHTPLIAKLANKYTPTYVYLFQPDNPPMYFNPGFAMKATHTSDLAYVFKNFGGAQGTPVILRPEDAALSNGLMASYVAFAKTGAPGPVNGAEWTRFNDKQNFMLLGQREQKMTADFSGLKACYAPDIYPVLDSPFY